MEEKKIRQLFRRYLLGKGPDREIDAVDNWYQAFDAAPLPEMGQEEEERVRQEIWQQVLPQITTAKTFYLGKMRRWAAAAAVLLIGVATAAYFLWPQDAYNIVSTRSGEQRTIQLEDGTRMVLNAGSTVRVSKNFSRERKLDIVDGEAYFDVKDDTHRPFIVSSGPLTTTVLGTAFNISAYEALHALKVSVVSGKVRVSAEGSENILQKDQALEFDRNTGRKQLMPLDAAQLEWQQGKLILNDASFEEMVVLMQKNFGINITATDEKVRKTRYTTDLPTSMEPQKAAEVLAAIHHLKIETHAHEILMYQ